MGSLADLFECRYEFKTEAAFSGSDTEGVGGTFQWERPTAWERYKACNSPEGHRDLVSIEVKDGKIVSLTTVREWNAWGNFRRGRRAKR